MFGLIDGNNFYVSCERAFDPTLIGKPVIVLSNNDGCAIARSAEAKALGIKMGEVWQPCGRLGDQEGPRRGHDNQRGCRTAVAQEASGG